MGLNLQRDEDSRRVTKKNTSGKRTKTICRTNGTFEPSVFGLCLGFVEACMNEIL